MNLELAPSPVVISRDNKSTLRDYIDVNMKDLSTYKLGTKLQIKCLIPEVCDESMLPLRGPPSRSTLTCSISLLDKRGYYLIELAQGIPVENKHIQTDAPIVEEAK